MTPAAVLKLVKEKKIQFIDLRFMDFPGLWQHFTIPAEALEEQLFRPVQGAYGRGRRTYTEFAQRYGLSPRSFEPGSQGAYSADPRVHLERAVAAIERADQVVAEMQDSMLPVEVGDRELRDGLTATRELIAAAPAHGRQLLRTIGR